MTRRIALHSLLIALIHLGLSLPPAQAGPIHDTSEIRESPSRPIDSLVSSLYIANEERSFIEGASGLVLRKGANLLFFEDGRFSLGKNLFATYQLKQSLYSGGTKNEFFRGYLKYHFSRFSVEGGKDNLNLGPGENGLLLSDHAPPYPLFIFQTERPFRFLGQWDFLLLHGWLIEDRQDVDRPNLMAFRLVWKPWSFLEFGGTRTTLYGGEGRGGFSLLEYPALLVGYKEHESGKWDNEGYAGYDISFYFTPPDEGDRSKRTAKLYFEHAATDFTAVWQKDRKETGFPLPFGFAFRHEGFLGGFLLSGPKDRVRLEYVKTDNAWYRHHQYPVEDYAYQELSLGYPYGSDMESLFLKHLHRFDDFSLEYRIGGYKQPASNPDKREVQRYYLVLRMEKEIRRSTLELYLRGDRTEDYDTNFLPNQFSTIPDDKTFFTAGLSSRWTF